MVRDFNLKMTIIPIINDAPSGHTAVVLASRYCGIGIPDFTGRNDRLTQIALDQVMVPVVILSKPDEDETN